MKSVFSEAYYLKKTEIGQMIKSFGTEGEILVRGKRNTLKLFKLDDKTINIKSFKIPRFANQVVYRFFRKSKARRSFEFAKMLLAKGIGTPQPIAYFENADWLMRDSYYLSEHLFADITFRELVDNLNYPEHEIILRQFTRFTFNLHENGIEFLDHTPGNTLIKKIGEKKYDFFLVDLNRMKFNESMTFRQRIINMSKLTHRIEIVEVISDEYAKLYGKNYMDVLNAMKIHIADFQNRFNRKKKIKKNILFRK